MRDRTSLPVGSCCGGSRSPDVGVFGLQVHDADAFIALLPHQTVGVKLREGGLHRHQLHHHPGRALVVADLKHSCVYLACPCVLLLHTAACYRLSSVLRAQLLVVKCCGLLLSLMHPVPVWCFLQLDRFQSISPDDLAARLTLAPLLTS